MYILGFSAFYHDSAACLIKDQEIISAVQEERFSRKKHDFSFPINSIKYCLKNSNISLAEIDKIVFYEKPFMKFERILETYLAFAPKGFTSFSKSMPLWAKDKLFQRSNIVNELNDNFGKESNWDDKLLFSEHHLSHAASAFYPSPFNEAAVLTMDAVGEWATSSISIGNNNKLDIIKEMHFPHSLGLLYSAFTFYTGFRVNSGEYKLMGLAPYGEPKYQELIKTKLIDLKEDGSFKLDMKYFDFCTGMKMTNENFNNLFGGPPRLPESEITQRDMDLAASVQKVTEEIILKTCLYVANLTGQKNLCLAGGVALNCVANGVLQRENIFKNIWIQPAAGDAGGAIGAALAGYHIALEKPSVKDIKKDKDFMKGSYLGPEYSDQEIKVSLDLLGAIYKKYDEKKLIDFISFSLSEGLAVGWMNGKMEFGPRALGNRSILADPRSSKMQKNLNLKVKFRESFRPFAPSILFEDLSDWFETNISSPYMLYVSNITQDKRIEDVSKHNLFGIELLKHKRSKIPAVTHVDNSARVQTVHQDTNPKFYKLLKKFKEITGCPILVNTSFNVRGEPIVCTPEDAFRCFMGTGLDILVIGDYVLLKPDQDLSLKENYEERYELD